jgi:7-carboxy-7-deazaguanine synthase
MLVSEIFGPTIQGEGVGAGRNCLFIRLALCNLECTWCDTAYTWAFTPEKAAKTQSGIEYNRNAESYYMDRIDVLSALHARWPIRSWPTMIVVSGGEPLIQANDKELIDLLAYLRSLGHEVHIETAGTITPPGPLNNVVSQYNVSPKLEHSGNLLNKRIKWAALTWFAECPRAWFKFVVRSVDDLNEVDALVKNHGIIARRVQIMPEGVHCDDVLRVAREVASGAVRRGYGLSLRSHILVWGNGRGI